MSTLRALVVPVGAPAYIEEFDLLLTFTTLRRLLNDGHLEGIRGAGWCAYCDEEGKLKRLPINALATGIAREHGWHSDDVLCGPVVFLGEPDSRGDDTSVPAFLEKYRDYL